MAAHEHALRVHGKRFGDSDETDGVHGSEAIRFLRRQGTAL
jgi:hypothetical protein